MKMRSIADYLSGNPVFAGLDAASVSELAGCAINMHIRPGEYLFRAGQPAEHFYVITRGRIALELFSPASGPHVLDSAGPGEVLDWPWLIPPHCWFFDGRAVESASVISRPAPRAFPAPRLPCCPGRSGCWPPGRRPPTPPP